MSQETMATHTKIAITAALTAAFCAETYLASGWQGFRWSSKSDRRTPITVAQAKGSKDLQALIDDHIHCKDNTAQHGGDHRERHQLSVWFSPYRQFPEVPLEGDDRGKGDYEYFSYVSGKKCGRIASNYGAFKNSPADLIFRREREKGLHAELLLARKLGYDLFMLDTRKAWIATGDQNWCRQDWETCTETSDGFMVINLKSKSGLIAKANFLHHSARMGDGVTIAQSIESRSITAARSSQWYAWEYPERGAAFRWSNEAANQTRAIDLPMPVIRGESPANLATVILSNPSVKLLLMEIHCTQGRQRQIRLTIQGSRDISEVVSRCQPKSVRVLRAIDQNSLIILGKAPRLNGNDPRQALWGIMYRLK